MTDNAAAAELLRLLGLEYPYEVDIFEDRLAKRLVCTGSPTSTRTNGDSSGCRRRRTSVGPYAGRCHSSGGNDAVGCDPSPMNVFATKSPTVVLVAPHNTSTSGPTA